MAIAAKQEISEMDIEEKKPLNNGTGLHQDEELNNTELDNSAELNNSVELNNDAETKEKIVSTSILQKLAYARAHISVEPFLAGLIIPSIISRFAMGNLNLDKACRVNLQINETICDALIKRTAGEYGDYEKQIQKLIASIDIWKSIIHTLIPCIIIMFLGAWSDRTGKRKLCILMPVFGELMTSINNIVNVYFFYEIPVQITIFLEVFFTAITGGWVTMFLGVYSYISDITTEENRTYRVGMVSICMTAGVPIGLGLSGILLQKMGYYGVFSITSALFLLVLVSGIVLLKEPERLLQEKGIPPIDRTGNADVSFFNVTHVSETLAVAFKSRPGNKRVKVILTLFVVFIIYGPSMAEHNVMYLFVRNRLNWDLVMFSLYATYSILIHTIGTLFSLIVLSRRMQFDDSILCLISITSKFVGSVWTAFVQTSVEMYLVPVIEILNATTFTTLRAIVSKTVHKSETARVNSLFSLVETLASLLFNPFYSWFYMFTLHSQSGAVFLLSAAMVVPAAFIVGTFFIQHRLALRKKNKMADNIEISEENQNKTNNMVEKALLDEKSKEDLRYQSNTINETTEEALLDEKSNQDEIHQTKKENQNTTKENGKVAS